MLVIFRASRLHAHEDGEVQHRPPFMTARCVQRESAVRGTHRIENSTQMDNRIGVRLTAFRASRRL